MGHPEMAAAPRLIWRGSLPSRQESPTWGFPALKLDQLAILHAAGGAAVGWEGNLLRRLGALAAVDRMDQYHEGPRAVSARCLAITPDYLRPTTSSSSLVAQAPWRYTGIQYALVQAQASCGGKGARRLGCFLLILRRACVSLSQEKPYLPLAHRPACSVVFEVLG